MNQSFLREEMLLGADALKKLGTSHVAVFGLGGVGSWCAEALARSGIGEITLIDCDTVGESNINRQLCALSSTVGMEKTAVMASRLRDINPSLLIHTICGVYRADDRERFFADYDFVADAIDLVSSKVDLIKTCIERDIPIISALGTGNKKDASLLKITDISKTENCALARVVRKELRAAGINHSPVVFSPELPIQAEQSETPPPGRRSIPGSLVWVPASAGFLMCQYIVTELIREQHTEGGTK